MDIKDFKIKNYLIVAGLAIGISITYLTEGYSGLKISLLGIIIPFILLFVFFVARLIGAGDIKLFCVIGCFTGPYELMEIFIKAFMLAGVIGVIKMIVCRNSGNRNIVRMAIPIAISVFLYCGGKL